RLTRSSSRARQAASLSPPMLRIASSTFWPSPRTPSATRSEIDVARLSSRTRATVPSRISRTIGSWPSGRTFQASPVALHLAPRPADHVLADRPGEDRVQRAPHPAGVGPREIGPGDQRIGSLGAALVGAKRGAPPFARLAVRARQPSARHGDAHFAERSGQRPLAMAMADAHDRRRRFILARLQPNVAR